MHKFLFCVFKSQDFTQSQKTFARSHNRETVNIKNSAEDILPDATPPIGLEEKKHEVI